MPNLEKITEEIRIELGEPDEADTNFTPKEVLNAINFTKDEMVRIVKFGMDQEDISSIINVFEYDLDAKIIQINEVQFDGAFLGDIEFREALKYRINPLSGLSFTGTPEIFYQRRKTSSTSGGIITLGLFPTPPIVKTISIFHVPRSPDLVAPADLPRFPEEWHSLLIHGSLERLWRSDGELSRSAREGALFRNGMNEMKQSLDSGRPQYVNYVDY